MSANTLDRRLVALIAIAVGVLLLLPVLGMGIGFFGGGHMGWGGTGMWANGTVPGWALLVGVAMQLLFLLALVGGAYLLYRALTDSTGSVEHGGDDPAIEELRTAYARGELSDEEFERRRERLERES